MDPQQTPETAEPEDESGAISNLAIIGVILLIIGAGILGWLMISSPGVIAAKELDASDTNGFFMQGHESDIVLTSWALFLAPLMVITGAIFTAAGCIVTAIFNR